MFVFSVQKSVKREYSRARKRQKLKYVAEGYLLSSSRTLTAVTFTEFKNWYIINLNQFKHLQGEIIK